MAKKRVAEEERAQDDPDASPGHKKAKPAAAEAIPDDASPYEIDEQELGELKSVMGIASFASSKGKAHSASAASAVMKVSKRKHRQVLGRPKRVRV